MDECEAHQLPLVELRREVRFVEITEEIHSTIVNRQLALLIRGEALHRRLTELMLDGVDIPRILAVLADAIGNPVLLEKAGSGVLYHAAHRSSTPDVLAAWDLARDGGTADPADGDNVLIHPVLGAGQQTWGHLLALPLESGLTTSIARRSGER